MATDVPPTDDAPDATGGRPRYVVVLVGGLIALVAVVALFLVATGGDDDDGDDAVATDTTAAPTTAPPETTAPPTTAAPVTTTTAPEPEPNAAYAESGPYAAGVTTIDLDGRFVEVWYPADPDGVAGLEPAVFQIRDVVPPELAALVPDELNPSYPTDAFAEAPPATDGPFPVVALSHGFGAWPTMYQFLGTHLASWGMVVVAPDHAERDLLAAASGNVTEGDDAGVLLGSVDAAVAASEAGAGVLAGLLDAERLATVGHSAGVRAATESAGRDDRVDTVVMMAGGSTEVVAVPVLVLAGGRDEVIPLDAILERTAGLTDRRIAVIDEAGHNAFNDICLIGQEQGGLLGITEQLGLPVDERLLGLLADGCTEEFLPAQEAWPAIRHLVTAQVRAAWGVDPEPVGLDDATVASFGPAITWDPGPTG
ncbi:MAG TPA: hypothetical protein VK866_04630 [Acidimicrobiales bacterium]|nr:hypothetical protein [Acidimicrobiales bacterium]